jgi:salicylate hydroxylase
MAWRGVIPTADLPKGIDYRIGATWIGPDAHIVHYPIRNGELLNFVGIVERPDWKVESWSAEGTVEECLSDFRGWHSDVQEIIRHITTPFKWALALRPPLPTWTDGRVTLLGDACHATLPLLAQGANMALEDGLVLARCLERHPTDIGAGLQSYEAARIARTQKLVRESADQLHRNSNPSLADPNTAKAYVEREWSKERVSGRYDWIFGYDASQVAVA